MSQSKEGHAQVILTNGLMNFANATGDKSIVEFGAIAYRDVRDVFAENIRSDNTCTFAFPSMIVRPEIRVECFVAILNDRVIVAWRKGIFRKTTVSQVIPKNTIRQAVWAISNRPDSRGAALLTITADETTEFALPKGKPAVADAVVAAVQAK